MVTYLLPNGDPIQLAYDLCHAATFVTYQMKGGTIVLAHLAPGQDIGSLYRAWRDQ